MSMSKLRRGKQLVALCTPVQSSINQIAIQLEEESSLLFPLSTISHQSSECQQLDYPINTTTNLLRSSSIPNVVLSTINTNSTHTLTTTSAGMAVRGATSSRFETRVTQDTIESPSCHNGCLEPILKNGGISDQLEDETTTSSGMTTKGATSSHTQDIFESPSCSNRSIPGPSEEQQWLNEKTGCLEPILENGGVSDQLEEEEKEDVATSENQKRKKNQKMRLLGKTYTGHKFVKDDENTTIVEVSKERRKLGPKPCDHGAAQISERSFSCAAINDIRREDLFKYFWQLSTWDAKKSYVNGLIQVRNIIRRRKTSAGVHPKTFGFDCYLPGLNGVKVRVCKEMFLATFDLKKDTLQLWIRSNIDVTQEEEGSSNKVRRIDRISNNSDITTTTLKSDSVKKWLDSVPKVPSHYCRANSNRTYVEDSFESVKHMHSEYTSWCHKNNEYAVQKKKFTEILENHKISIFKPRKDQCDTCVSYKEGNESEESYQLHIMKKDEARIAKTEAVQQVSDDVAVITMDMQSVLLCPKLLVSEQYYKMKLALHNYTFRVHNTKDVYLYVWHEGDGGIAASNITSCIIDFLRKYCSSYKKVLLISDGCSYQNKNKVLSSSLANLSAQLGITIEQIILEKGHTMMEVDSVHSTLEKKFKAPIYSPSDYINRMMQARPSQPYFIHHLDFTFFLNYEAVPGGFPSIRPGKKVGDPTVTDIRGLLYVDGDVKYKLRHPDDWTTLPQRRNPTFEDKEATRLYNSPIKIDTVKFNHLQSLKKYMHRDYHSFYDNLPH